MTISLTGEQGISISEKELLSHDDIFISTSQESYELVKERVSFLKTKNKKPLYWYALNTWVNSLRFGVEPPKEVSSTSLERQVSVARAQVRLFSALRRPGRLKEP